jgi:hypothetical protein
MYRTNFIPGLEEKRAAANRAAFERSKPVAIFDFQSDYSDPSCDDDDFSFGERIHEPCPNYSALIIRSSLESEASFRADAISKTPALGTSIKPRHRPVVIDWLIRAALDGSFSDETICLAVAIFDRAIAACRMRKAHIQLFSAASLWIASKIEEPMTPSVSDFIYLCANMYAELQFVECERVILRGLAYRVAGTTPLVYVDAHSATLDAQVVQLTRLLLLTALTSSLYPDINPSAAAAAALNLASRVSAKTIKHDYEVPKTLADEFEHAILSELRRIIEDEANLLLPRFRRFCERFSFGSIKDLEAKLRQAHDPTTRND